MLNVYDFANPVDYSFVNALLSGGKGRLGLVDLPLQNFQQLFTSSAGFAFDAAKAEFVANKLQKKDQRPAGATFGATFTSGVNATWSSGSPTGTLTGDATINNGKLHVSANLGSAAKWDYASNFGVVQTGTIRFRFKPNYSGTPAGVRYLFSSGENISPYRNRIYLDHNSAGNIEFVVYSSTGTLIFGANLGGWAPVAGTEYEFEVNIDVTSGATRVFINGVQKGATQTGTGTRNTDGCSIFAFGANSAGGTGADGSFDDIEIFSTVQHTENYTPGYSVPETLYSESAVTCPEIEYTGLGTLIEMTNFIASISGNVYFSIQIGRSGNYLWWNDTQWAISNGTFAQSNSLSTFLAHIGTLAVEGEIYGQFRIHFASSNLPAWIESFTATLTGQAYAQSGRIIPNAEVQAHVLNSIWELATKPTGTGIKYIVSVDDVDKYWSGTAWATSTSDAQSNTLADINLHLATLLGVVHKSCKIITVLTSDGSATPEISELQLDYTYGGLAPSEPVKCVVYGYLTDLMDQPIEGAKIKISLFNKDDQYQEARSRMLSKAIEITTDAQGYWEAELIATSEFEGDEAGIYLLEYKKGSEFSKTKLGSDKITFSVPDSLSANICDILTAA